LFFQLKGLAGSFRSAASPFINAGLKRDRRADRIQQRDKSISEAQAQWADLFVATCAHNNPAFDASNASATAQFPKKFNVFHQRNFGKAADAFERVTPAKHAVVAAAHAQQKACVVSKTIR
jgi:hypothetical protein